MLLGDSSAQYPPPHVPDTLVPDSSVHPCLAARDPIPSVSSSLRTSPQRSGRPGSPSALKRLGSSPEPPPDSRTPLALSSSLPEPGTLQGQARQPEGRPAPKPPRVSRALGCGRAARGALSLPARLAPPSASFREAESTRARRGPVRASREPASARGHSVVPLSPPGDTHGSLRRALPDLPRRTLGTHTYLPSAPSVKLCLKRPPPHAVGRNGEEGKEIAGSSPFFLSPHSAGPPPAAPHPWREGGGGRRGDDELASPPPPPRLGDYSPPSGGRNGNRRLGWTEPT